MSAVQLQMEPPPSSTKAAAGQGPYRAESTFHANWVADNGERICSSCWTLTRVYLVGERLLCLFCQEHEKGKKR